MPFVSVKQKRFMEWKHPEIAARWKAEAKMHGTPAVSRQGSVGKAYEYIEEEDIAKGWFNAASRNTRRAARATRRAERVNARGGPWVRRNFTGPAAEDASATMRNAREEATRTASETAETINRAGRKAAEDIEGAGSRTAKKIGWGIGGGLAAGIGGGVTIGEIGRQGVKGFSNRQQQRRADQRELAVRRARPVRKADADYPFLLSTIRREAGIGGMPESRSNPVSPLQMLAASGVMAEGYSKWRNESLFRKKKHRQQAMYEILMGQSVAQRGVGGPM
jgi:hypothetical protein